MIDMNITLITKLKRDGRLCAKSATVMADLAQRGLLAQINQTIVADERDPGSAGYRLAAEYQVEAAPFFLVNDGQQVIVYAAYYKLLREILGQTVDETFAAVEMMHQNPDLDFI
jgi:hypothetical protein